MGLWDKKRYIGYQGTTLCLKTFIEPIRFHSKRFQDSRSQKYKNCNVVNKFSKLLHTILCTFLVMVWTEGKMVGLIECMPW